MSAKLKTMLAAAGAGAVAVVAVPGGSTPAFAKASETLSGPRTAHVQHAFQLAVQVGDDGGAKHASARLQVRGPHGGYQWLGGWHQLRSTGQQPPDWETYSFTVTENHPGTYTFRAVINSYPATSPTTVVVR
jgi:hypothetical protein